MKERNRKDIPWYASFLPRVHGCSKRNHVCSKSFMYLTTRVRVKNATRENGGCARSDTKHSRTALNSKRSRTALNITHTRTALNT